LTHTGGALALATVAGPTFLLEGCSTSTIADAITSAFSSILTYLKNSGVLTDNTLVQAATAALSAFKDAYDAWVANANAGTLAALGGAAQAALNDVQAFLSATDIGGPIAQVVLALAEVVISSLESFLTPPAATMLKLKGAIITASIPPVTRTREQFVTAFNTVCDSYGHRELRIK
jgi:hypothetical protein